MQPSQTALTSSSRLDRARAYLAKIPPAVSGQGGHNQTFTAACALVSKLELSQGDAWRLLEEYNSRCLPPWSERELAHKFNDALRVATGAAPIQRRPPVRSATIDPAKAARAFLNGFECPEADLWEASPVRLDDEWTRDAALLASYLYRSDERLNFVDRYTLKEGKAVPASIGETLPQPEFVARLQEGPPPCPAGGWLRMNPVDGHGTGDANVTAYRFALMESDALPPDVQLSLWARLPLPIAAILTSGGRSVHAWVKVDAECIDDYRNATARLLATLARFGVDGQNKNPSRLSRMPGALRTIGAAKDGRQRLLYLNPEPKQEAICPQLT